jgi:hypothetical protein
MSFLIEKTYTLLVGIKKGELYLMSAFQCWQDMGD